MNIFGIRYSIAMKKNPDELSSTKAAPFAQTYFHGTKAREDAAKAKKENQQLQATYTEALAGKDAEIARLQRKLAQKK